MALPPALKTLYDILQGLNGDPWNPTSNPLGLARGGNQAPSNNFIKAMKTVADYGKGISDLASSASTDALAAAQSAASALAERQGAQNAATNSYDSAREAAAKVTLAAAEVDKAKAEVVNAQTEVGRAKAEADRAKSYANGLNLPAVTPEMAGRFLKVNAAGTAYELGLITVATTTEINSGTGKGFANAETLGPILQSIKDTTAAAAAATPEIGSYLLRPANLPAPGPNWLETKGQIVSLVSYPGLATALPAEIKQIGAQNPAGPSNYATQISSGSGTQSAILQSLFEGNRFASLQSDYVRFQDPAAGKNFERQMGPNAQPASDRFVIPPVIRDNNEIVYLVSGASQVAHIDLNTQAGLDAGVRGSNTNVEPSSSHSYEGLYKLPNGTLIFVSLNNNGAVGNYQRIWKLPPQSAFNAWQSFEPIGGTQSNVMPSYFPHFQTKSGHVYALLSATSGSKEGPAYNVYRTLDGSSWQNVGQVTFPTTTKSWVAGGKRREVNWRLFSVMEESPDGQDVIVTLNGVGFLVTSNGGASWTLRTANSLLGLTALGFNDPTNEAYRVGYSWDAIGGQWVFSYFGSKTATANQQYILTLTGSRLTNLAKYQEVKLTSLTSGPSSVAGFIFRTRSFFHIIFSTGGSQYRLKVPIGSTGNIELPPSNNNLGSPVGLYLTGILFDGIVLMGEDSTNYTYWIFNDDSEQIQAYSSSFQMKGFTFSASPDGMNVAIQGSFPSASQVYIYKNPAYDYNPATERKLPNTYFQTPGGSLAVQEQYRPTASQPKFFMRVK